MPSLTCGTAVELRTDGAIREVASEDRESAPSVVTVWLVDDANWWSGFERYRVLDALHEAGHAIAAALLGASNIRLRLDPENFEDRGSVEFDLGPSLTEPDGGWQVDLDGAGADAFGPLSGECDGPTRLWVVTRAGGVGGLVGCRALGLAVEIEGVMEGCEHDDRALARLLRSAPAAAAQRWVNLRYCETWALLLRHEDAVVAVARHAVEGDGKGVDVELARITDDAASGWAFSENDLAGAADVASDMGFGSWPDWREYEIRRFEEFKEQFS